MNRVYSRDELPNDKGAEGSPVLTAYEGKVYDVSLSYHWEGGRHHASHQAGQDSTKAMETSPHGPDLLVRVCIVGILDG